MIVALDAASISSESPRGPEKALQPGDFVWLYGGPGHECVFRTAVIKKRGCSKLFFHTSLEEAGEGGRKR